MSQRQKPPRTRVAIPATNALKDSDLVPSKSQIVSKALDKISRAGVFELVQTWLKDDAPPACAPLLAEDDTVEVEGDYAPADTVKELRNVYEKLDVEKATKNEVIDRIREGDWHHGISIFQLATVDMQHLAEHPMFLTWKAYKIVLRSVVKASDRVGHKKPKVPRLDTRSMIKSVQPYLAAMARAYCNIASVPSPSVKILRVQVFDTPYSVSRSRSKFDITELPNSFITVYTVIPENSDHIFMASKTERSGGLSKTFQPEHISRIIVDALARGISKQYERYKFKSVSLSSQNLEALIAQSSGGVTAPLGGGWSFIDGGFEGSPLQMSLTINSKKRKKDEKEAPEIDAPSETAPSKRPRVNIPQTRSRPTTEKGRAWAKIHFRDTALPDDGKGLESLSVRIEEPFVFPSSTGRRSTISPANDTVSKPSERFQNERPWSASRKFGPGLGPTPESKGLPHDKSSQRRTTQQTRQYSASPPPLPSGPPPAADCTALDSQPVNFSSDLEPPETPPPTPFNPTVQITFHGTHVFAGVRTLVETEVIEGKTMPKWMAGSEGFSRGVVREGRLVGEDEVDGDDDDDCVFH
ncbi:MAG: hypothetical protein MMC33_000902 [Icmadophila ericetorum]|nr:hypothetical protein [Icmadophila ericetorum]